MGTVVNLGGENGLICGLSATDADAANSLATIGMSSYAEIGGSGVGETVNRSAMLRSVGDGQAIPRILACTASNLDRRLVQREHIPEAWDDSDDENADVDAIVPSASVSSLLRVRFRRMTKI